MKQKKTPDQKHEFTFSLYEFRTYFNFQKLNEIILIRIIIKIK